MKHLLLLFLAGFTFLPMSVLAQLSSTNGFLLPVQGKIRVLLVFAELDCDSCSTLCHPNNSEWLPGTVPSDAGTLFDGELSSGQLPTGLVTKYYYDASFGDLVVLGDYMPQIFTVPCQDYYGSGVENIYDMLDSMSSPIVTANGYTLDDFDLRNNELQPGLLKNNSSNGVIDFVMVIWRNNHTNDFPYGSCASGYGASNIGAGNTVKNKTTSVGSSFNSCLGATAGFVMITSEYFHSMYGGNEYHTGSGAGRYTFPFTQASYSITG